MTKQKIWYSRNELLSKGGLFNFCLGARGTGKTYDYKKFALTSEHEVVWVRRYQEDIDDLKTKFLGDMKATNVITDEDEVKIDEDILYINDVPKIYFVPLSTSGRKKSQSYYNVNWIIFDEVFEGVGNRRYLKNEVELFLELYETVNRLRGVDGDTRPQCRVVFISNKTSWVNPYFAYFKIQPFSEKFKKYKDGLIWVENYENKEFVALKKQTPFGKLIDGTPYGGYAIDNEVWLDDNAFLAPRPADSIEKFVIHYGKEYIGCWSDGKYLYCSYANNHDLSPTYGMRFACGDNERPLQRNKRPVKDLIELYDYGLLRFEDNIIKSIIFTVMQTGGLEK